MAAAITLTDKPTKPAGGRLVVRVVLASCTAIATLWLLGIGWYLYLASSDAPPPPPHADAIVVLTGGPDRIEVALRLLAAGAADRLLISGAGEKTDLASLAYQAEIDPAPLERQITVGHAAHSTRGNALETAAWVRNYDINSVLLVTSWFHMPRALVELRRAMPAVTVHPYPVGRPDAEGLTHVNLMRHVIGEYHKYLAASAGLTSLPRTIVPWGTE
jgi:uncharacterized SAM-binding protein YcdF (DUF218 family)